MRMPRRRWTDFPAGLRRVRVSSGLTQSDLAEMLAVDQATISRWERGAQMPDAEMQGKLRDILFRGRAISDARLTHFVRSAYGLMALISADGEFVAVSEPTRSIVAESHKTLKDIMTPTIEEAWNAAVNAGFFRGEVASVHVATEVTRVDGAKSYFAGSLHPAPLTDGAVLMLVEGHEIDLERYQTMRAQGLRITPIEEIL